MASSAASILQRQYKELTRHPVPGFVVDLKNDNIFEWDVAIIGSPKTIYEGGYFKATMSFPDDYPFNPPTFRFNRDFYHPNVYPDGRLCISILHPPGDDPVSGEKAEERWNPTQSVESVLISIVSLFADPNCSSPANVDAGVAYRKNRELFDNIVRTQVEASKKDIPPGFQMPKSEKDFMIAAPAEIEEDENFWYDSAESDFLDEDDEEEL
ncbi:hypothetical protein K492DRAFT_170244 [Lichtheimia hyalospora FSU 10163]|nr:hypothetical protein K492DRAFT_170244 [Lichtheimia hyalospora FSU 10163]